MDASSTLPGLKLWIRVHLGEPQFPQMQTELRAPLMGASAQGSSGPREDPEVPSGGACAPGSQSYHELGMAVLEGAPRVPVALLLAIHHAALHGILDLGRERGVSVCSRARGHGSSGVPGKGQACSGRGGED